MENIRLKMKNDSSKLKKELTVHTCRICKKSDICKGVECEFCEVFDVHYNCVLKTKKQT